MGKMKYFEQIEDFVEGNMTKVESEKFESNLQNDVALKAEYDAYLAAEIAVKALGYELLVEKHTKKPRRLIKLWVSIAATVLLLVMSSVWYAHSNYSTPVIVSNSLAEVEPNFTTLRGDGSGNSTSLDEAVRVFYSTDFTNEVKIKKIETLLSPIPITDTTYISAQLILGYAYLKSNNFDKATISFFLVMNDDKTLFAANAKWGQILSLLSAGRDKGARYHLQIILNNPSNEYYTKALELKKQLESGWRKLVF